MLETENNDKGGLRKKERRPLRCCGNGIEYAERSCPVNLTVSTHVFVTSAISIFCRLYALLRRRRQRRSACPSSAERRGYIQYGMRRWSVKDRRRHEIASGLDVRCVYIGHVVVMWNIA